MFRSIWDDMLYQFRQGSVVVRLISICIAVFLGFETLHLFFWASGHEGTYRSIYYLFSLPLSLSDTIRQPWSVFTFMFMHADFWHIFYNLLWLYWFGEIYQLYMNDRRLLPIFVFGSIAGATLAMIAYAILPPLRAMGSSYLVGASAGIEAIMFAATALNPDHRVRLFIIGEVPIKYIAAASFVISYLAIPNGNAAGMISHICGAIFGYLYIVSLRSGTDWFVPLDKIAGMFNPKSKLKTSYVNNQRADIKPKNTASTDEQKQVDDILDKIAKSGYNSLSKEEKDFLFKYSNK